MIRDDLATAVRSALGALGVDPLPEQVNLERPANREHGDWSTNVALASAKKAGRNPRELATELVAHLSADLPRHVEAIEIAGPGFVNFRLAPTWLHDVLVEVIDGGVAGYARPDLGGGERVNVEFVSANPTGPVHAGHARGAAFGDSVARLLERTGHVVTREFYINDRGVQMQNFGASLAARKAGQEPPEDGYHGQYIIDWAQGMPDAVDPVVWGEERAIADQREVLGSFGVRFDEWFSEMSLVESGAITETLAALADRNATYEADGAVWLRSSEHGDDKDRVLVKSDGEYTYLLPDIAYHRNKFARSDRLINVWGADHHGYIARMRAAMELLGEDPGKLEVAIVQLVDLLKDGEPMKLSKRAGTVIELRDIIDEVGADAARLTYLLQSLDSRQTVDLAEVASQGMDNPVFYVQMAHARIHGIARKAAESGHVRGQLDAADLSLLTHERELDVLRSLSELPDIVAIAARDRAPHRITSWVRDLANAVHGFYHDCYVVGPDIEPELTVARLWLVESARIGLGIGLDLLGVSAPEQLWSVLPWHLLPDSAEVGSDGQLLIGGCDLAELVEQYGTPLFVYDEAHLRARCREAVEAFGDGVAYATKAFLCRAMARLAYEEGMHLDVASGGELSVALSAGVPAERLVLHGNNKDDDELGRARQVGVGRIVVDSFDELDRLERLHAADGLVPQVLLRVTPGVEAHTHEFVMTGQDDSKFGFGLKVGDAARAVDRARASSAVDLVGLHAHIGSQVFVAGFFEQAVEALAPFVHQCDLPELSIGGGIGVAYVEGESAPSLAEWGAVVRRACEHNGITARVSAEPGRAIAASAAVTVYRVGTIKEVPGIRTFVACDGGFIDNPRPALYGSGYETFAPSAVQADRSEVVRLVGKHCESGDVLVPDAKVPPGLQVGDLIATPVTGAYGRSMGSNYNLIPRPAAVFVAGGRARLVIRRETIDDLLATDVG